MFSRLIYVEAYFAPYKWPYSLILDKIINCAVLSIKTVTWSNVELETLLIQCTWHGELRQIVFTEQ